MKNFPDWFFNHADWQEKFVKDICSLSNGKKLSNKIFPYLDVKYFRGNQEKVFVESGNYIAEGSKIILVDGENSGEIFTAKEDGYMGSTFRELKIDESVDENYFKFYIETKKELYKKNKTGTAIPHLNKELFYCTCVPIPPLETQKKIADYFTHLDNAINAQETKLQSWRDAKKALLQKIFSQEFYFTQENGEKYPAWQEKTLGEVAEKIGSGKTPKGGANVYQNSGIFFIRSQNVFNGELNFDDIAYISKKIDAEMKNSRVYENDILIVITGNVGRCCVYKKNLPANVSQHVCIVRLKENNSEFVANQILSNKIQSQIKKIQTGGTREGLNFQQVASLKIKLPCLEEQKKIADYFSSLDKIIDAESKMLESLRQMKRGLFQKLFV